MASTTLNGKITKVFPKVQITETVSKIEMVIDTEEENKGKIYTQTLLLTFSGKNIELAKGLKVNDEKTFTVDIRGRVKEKQDSETRY